MRAVILGASGLIGHKLFQVLSARFDEVFAVLHHRRSDYSHGGLFDTDRVVEELDVRDLEVVEGVLKALSPDAVLNCTGITKRRDEIDDLSRVIEVNAKFPHWLARWTAGRRIRVIQFSTDCVFEGGRGAYSEEDPPDAEDIYGRTKALGELRGYDHALTIRSSFIGRELEHRSELLEWFLSQEGGVVEGYENALYSGVSTPVMARVVGDVLEEHPELSGLYHLSIEKPISKHDLLLAAKDAFGVDIEIVPTPEPMIDRSLRGDKLRSAVAIDLPSWPEMMEELAAESDFYEGNSGEDRNE